MDFTLDDTAQQVAELAATVLRDVGEHARVMQSQAGAAGYDETAWKALAQAGLLALAIPSEHGGDGLGAVEIATVLTAVGRQAVSLPAFATLALGVLPLTRVGAAQHLTGVADGVVLTASARGVHALRRPGGRTRARRAVRRTSAAGCCSPPTRASRSCHPPQKA